MKQGKINEINKKTLKNRYNIKVLTFPLTVNLLK